MKSKFTLHKLIPFFFLTFFAVALSYTAAIGQTTLPRPDHILVLIEENQPNAFVIGQPTWAPYINALAADTDAATLAKMYAIEHPSQPDYLDLFAGSNQGVLDDAIPVNYPFVTPNMARELIDKGFSFVTYSQNLPAEGSDVGSSNGYARKHNPVVNWQGTGTNQVPVTCNEPMTAFPGDFSLLPTVSYVVPVEDSDMHNGFGMATVLAGDYWMHEHLDTFFRWVKAHNSLFIYIFDEDNGLQGNNIPCVFYGPMVKGGSYSDHWNLYNVLRTIEDMYGTTHAGNAATVAPIANIWRAGTTSGIADIENEPTVKVYPNPASDIIRFKSATDKSLNGQIRITDVTGRTIHEAVLSASKTYELNVSQLPEGLYFYRVDGNNNTAQTGKFIVSHSK